MGRKALVKSLTPSARYRAVVTPWRRVSTGHMPPITPSGWYRTVTPGRAQGKLRDPGPYCMHDRLRARRYMQLLEDPAYVVLDRLFREVECRTDLFVRHAVCN